MKQKQIIVALSEQIPKTWQRALQPEVKSPYFAVLERFIEQQIEHGKSVCPPVSKIFNALNGPAPNDVKVVILGQDPYPNVSQAHGLSFSVPHGIAIPKSLLNIFKELSTDVGFNRPQHGNLQKWVDQGVLLLNTVLTVQAGAPGSHRNRGWEIFTDSVIHIVNQQNQPVVFLLWGADARSKVVKIDQSKHHVLQAPHPSPLSAYRGFFGCQHFSKCNALLQLSGREPIDWQT